MVSLTDAPSASHRLSDQTVLPLGSHGIRAQNYTLVGREEVQLVGDTTSHGVKFKLTDGTSEPRWLRRIIDQLNAFAGLGVNWDSYGAAPIGSDVLVAALQVLAGLMRAETPIPALIPLSSGGLQIEWHQQGIDIEVEITSQSSAAFVHDSSTGTEWEGIVRSDGGPLRGYLDRLADPVQAMPRQAG